MANNASAAEVAKIRALASKPDQVKTTKGVTYSLMSLNLTTDDICSEIVGLIDAGERVKPVTLHSFPGKIGNQAYEMKTTINQSRIYIKVTIETIASGEEMLILSSHRDL